MPDEASTPPADTQAPPSEPVTPPAVEPPKSEDTSGQATPPSPSAQGFGGTQPEAAAPAPEPNTPTTTSVGTDTPPQAGGEETTAPPKSEDATGQEAEVSEPVPESTPEPQVQPEPAQSNSPAPQATQSVAPPTSIIDSTSSRQVGELLVKARAKIQERRRKKLEKIMTKVTETGKISNNEVQKLLRVSDATATRYLDMLEKEGRLRQEGKTGKSVVYVKG